MLVSGYYETNWRRTSVEILLYLYVTYVAPGLWNDAHLEPQLGHDAEDPG